jgi:uncharacterized protein YdgA (DUF945 family)
MKKLLLSVAVLLVIAWAGASWYVGRQTEPALQQFIDAGNKQYESYGITQEIVSYKYGLFRSRAITRLTTSTAPFNEIIGDVQFVNDITNGPVFFGGSSPVQFGIARISTRLDMDSLDEDKRQLLAKAFGGKQPCESHLIINFNGVVDYSVSLNPMKLDIDGTTFVIQSAHVAGSADADMLGEFRLQADNIEARMDGSIFSVPSLESSGTITGIIAGQALGSFNVSMPQVSIKSQDSAEAFMFDADFKTNSDVVDNSAEGSFNLVMDNIQGAGGMLNKLDYSAEFEGLNIAGLEAINQITKDMANLQNRMALDDEAMQTPEGQQKMQELLSGFPDRFITAIFSDLLQTGKSRMRHVLVAESPGGAGTADIDLTYIGEGTPGMNDLVSYSPDDWVAMMKGTIVLNIDRSMLPEPFVMMLMPFIQQGIVVEEGEKLKANIELEGESIILNGQRMRFSDLLHMVSPPAAENTAEGNINAAPDIPDDIMLKIQEEGLTPEVMQLLEERDDVPAETVEMFRQLQQLQQEMQTGNMPDQR